MKWVRTLSSLITGVSGLILLVLSLVELSSGDRILAAYIGACQLLSACFALRPPASASNRPRLGATRKLPSREPELRETFGAQIAEAAMLHGGGTDAAERIAATSPPREWWTTLRRARHEAAHALVAHLCGATIVSAHVNPDDADGDGGSVTSTRLGLGVGGVEIAWHSLLGAIAGSVQDEIDGIRDSGSLSDMHGASAYAAQLMLWAESPPGHSAPLTMDTLLQTARGQVRAMLSEHAATLAAIADRLTERAGETLTEHDLVDLWPGTPPEEPTGAMHVRAIADQSET